MFLCFDNSKHTFSAIHVESVHEATCNVNNVILHKFQHKLIFQWTWVEILLFAVCLSNTPEES